MSQERYTQTAIARKVLQDTLINENHIQTTKWYFSSVCQLFLQNLANSFQKDVENKSQANKNVKLRFVTQQKFWIFLVLLAFKIEAAP